MHARISRGSRFKRPERGRRPRCNMPSFQRVGQAGVAEAYRPATGAVVVTTQHYGYERLNGLVGDD